MFDQITKSGFTNRELQAIAGICHNQSVDLKNKASVISGITLETRENLRSSSHWYSQLADKAERMME